VLLFHGDHLTGGYLGVDLFFVLSGFLITSLLLAETRATSRVSLLAFWSRRARRLLPALFLVLAAVGVYCVVFAAPEELHRIRMDELTTLGYVANWRFVFGHFDYWSLFSAASPLNHTWSLAIEEQFYVSWPLVFVAVLAFSRSRPGPIARRVLHLCLALALCSAALMIGLYQQSGETNRVYYGTDTRAASILIGAALGALLAWRGPARTSAGRRRVELSGWIGVAILGFAWVQLSGTSAWLYRGGLLVCAFAAAAVIAAAVHPRRGGLARALGFTPLVGLGLISYGVYLWHWPVYVVMSPDRIGWDGWPLLAARIGVTLAIALVSYRLVEQPIRRGAFTPATMRVLTPVAAGALIAVALFSTSGYESPTSAAAAGVRSPDRAAERAESKPLAQRLLVVGNSVAYFLAGEGLTPVSANGGPVVLNSAMPGCDFPPVDEVRFTDLNPVPAPDCRAPWRDAVTLFRPDVVLFTTGDSGDIQFHRGEEWVTPCSAAYRSWYPRELEDATRRLSQSGARVAVMTSASSLLTRITAADRRQTECTNTLIRRFASRHPTVQLIDLARYLCPTPARCRAKLDGVELRPDGVHYRGPGAQAVARWLLPQLTRLAPVGEAERAGP
jgi:peptidoglycan/LPS O-acetylase OafA/YrhL